MVTHLLADGFFVFRAGGEHFAVSVPRRVPSQFRGRGRHARNLPQGHARVQRQDGASIPAADPCKKAENVLSSSGLLLQVCQIVFHEFNAFFTEVFPHRRPQTSILLPVGVPNFVGVADRRSQAAIGCRIRQSPGHNVGGFFQQHRRGRLLLPGFQESTAFNGSIVDDAFNFFLQHIPVHRQRVVVFHFGFVIAG